MSQGYTTINAILHRDHPRDQAVRVSRAGDDKAGAWIGRKWIRDMAPTGQQVRGRNWLGQHVMLPEVSLSIPLWLAKETRLA